VPTPVGIPSRKPITSSREGEGREYAAEREEEEYYSPNRQRGQQREEDTGPGIWGDRTVWLTTVVGSVRSGVQKQGCQTCSQGGRQEITRGRGYRGVLQLQDKSTAYRE
jgi:hypothetical protein